MAGLLRADESDYSTELCTLRSLLSDDPLVDTFGLGQIGGALEHAVLECEHLLKSVVEEWRAEADCVRAGGGKSHLKLARPFLLRLFIGGRLLLLGLWSGDMLVEIVDFDSKNGPFDECDTLCHLRDPVRNAVGHDGVCGSDAGVVTCSRGSFRRLRLARKLVLWQRR